MNKTREVQECESKGDLPSSFADGENEAYSVQEGTGSRSHSISMNKLRLRPPAQEKQKQKLENTLTEVFAALYLGNPWVPLISFFLTYYYFYNEDVPNL